MKTIMFILLVYTISEVKADEIRFSDVSIQAGIKRPFGRRLKYGGAVVADLDADGYPDIIIGHHDQKYADLYFNQRNGRFKRAAWMFWRDTHSFSPFHASARTKRMQFFASTGGSRGGKLSKPELFNVGKARSIKKVSDVSFAKGRGRTVVPIPLRPTPGASMDFIFMNSIPIGRFKGMKQHYASTISSSLVPIQKSVQVLSKDTNSFGTAADVNMDGRMELITFHDFRMYKMQSDFVLKDITINVLPRKLDRRSIVAIAELDFDNDGKMDLYIARSVKYYLNWMEPKIGAKPTDYLLRNVGGRYVDVTKKAGILFQGESRGVTVGDFNNDGWVDILVTQHTGPDKLFVNRGNGKFYQKTPSYQKNKATRGDHPVSVDYNRDGRLDLILSEGDHSNRNHGGFLRILKNVGPPKNWLLVRVGASLKGTATSLHALVQVKSNGRSMVRRVGSPGTSTGISYIELVHFGLGDSTNLLMVTVTWTDTVKTVLKSIKPNQVVTIGKV